MQFSPYSSPIPLVFQEQVSSRNFEGFTWALNDGGVGKIGNFSAFKPPYLRNGARYDYSKVVIDH